MESSTPDQPQSFDAFAAYYDDDYRDYDADVDAILELATEQAGNVKGSIVELGCGTGRILLPLAQMEHKVTGIDVSPALLGVARRKVEAAGLGRYVTFIQGDLRDMLLPAASCTLAICTSNTLMHFITPEDQSTVLKQAFRLLAPGGLLFIDLFNPDLQRLFENAGVTELADRWTTPDGGQVIKWSVRHVDPAEQLQETLFIYEEIAPDGATRKTLCPFTLRYLWRNEAVLMLATAGFEVEEVWGDFDGSDYENGCDHLILLARRP